MAAVDDLRRSVDSLKAFADTIADGLAEVSITLGKVSAELTEILAQLAVLEGTPGTPAEPDVTFAADALTDTTAKVVWTTDDVVQGWRLGRDGQDTNGSGAWSTVLPAKTMTLTFGSLKAGTTYNLTLEPVLASGVGRPMKLSITTRPAVIVVPPPTGGGGGGGGGATDHGPMALSAGWTERARDDFGGTAVDSAKWSIYNSLGHGNKGLRRPEAFSIVADPTAMGGTCLRVFGDAAGKTGGMAHKTSQRFGRWSGRMRFPKGDSHYHPVLLTWPSAENWPTGGEIDFAEGNCSSNEMQFFLHYSSANHQTSGDITIDTTKWHWYEMEWSPTAVRGWCDGVKYFEDTNQAHFNYSGFGEHHGTIQLDWFPGTLKTTGTGEMYVDAYRVYSM